ncbi:MAG: ArsR/SmtB family transcription factor [Vulcanimicrobiaceae bacterium]
MQTRKAPVEPRDRLADTLYAKFFSGLADETRLRIVRYLLEGPRTAGEIVTELGMSQSRISNQLSCLKWCGYVHAERHGRNVMYRIASPAIGELLSIAQRLVAANACAIAECTQLAQC